MIAPVMAPGTPPYWMVYFGSDDVAADEVIPWEALGEP